MYRAVASHISPKTGEIWGTPSRCTTLFAEHNHPLFRCTNLCAKHNHTLFRCTNLCAKHNHPLFRCATHCARQDHPFSVQSLPCQTRPPAPSLSCSPFQTQRLANLLNRGDARRLLPSELAPSVPRSGRRLRACRLPNQYPAPALPQPSRGRFAPCPLRPRV
jgi:hypothetical protein